MSTQGGNHLDVGEATVEAGALRAAMVDELLELGAIRSPTVAHSFRRVPRHLFAPGATLRAAYTATGTVVPLRDERDRLVSTVSAPHIQAMMLEQAGVTAGLRVLEIGSGGYNAALLAELVGETGLVTTVDIDPEVVARTRRCLDAAGYQRVDAVLADADDGVPGSAPYDLVIVTAAAWTIPQAWTNQLAPGGRLVVPLRLRGLTRSVVFESDGGRLVSRDYQTCSFVPFRGVGAPPEQVILLGGEDAVIRLEEPPSGDVEQIRQAATWPRIAAWSGLSSGEAFDDLQLWLALGLNDFGLLMARQAAVDRGVVTHAWPLGIPTALGKGSFAYLALSPKTVEQASREFGVYAHGPEAEILAAEFVARIRSWRGTGHRARIEAFPAGTPNAVLPAGGVVLDRRDRRLVVSWPDDVKLPG
ncbi:protein-L-isoaspartate(D-aspartate) O-methyltransferase [Frankia sp. AiPs1]|uniref:methyltransferase, FxLD system n=1 Tax=Frankia sp. AiPa1 TaxID=573492 RepID=UPI00202B265A|nr:methyltransferase, FxLD system [Frankia sp. AiPa1]MCL9760409.1 methyltransferase, FxLD system [Frankia sp. AiPa1]